MSTRHVEQSRRNAAVLGATTVTVGALFLFPTSTNQGGSHRLPGKPLAPAGVVAPAGGGTAAAGATSAARTLVVNGASAGTRYGPVQVQLRVRAGRILSAKAIDYPQGSGRDRDINSYAIPVLEQEAVRAQSARIDTVSGATYTSDGYVRSLQAALDSAHLK